MPYTSVLSNVIEEYRRMILKKYRPCFIHDRWESPLWPEQQHPWRVTSSIWAGKHRILSFKTTWSTWIFDGNWCQIDFTELSKVFLQVAFWGHQDGDSLLLDIKVAFCPRTNFKPSGHCWLCTPVNCLFLSLKIDCCNKMKLTFKGSILATKLSQNSSICADFFFIFPC